MPRTDLSQLIAELDKWSSDDPATFWWRDDDAAEPTRQLDALLQVAAGRPLALAVIPCCATSDLAGRLSGEPHVSIFQHGWKHQNYAEEGPNSEYPPGRSESAISAEFGEGFAKLSGLFGRQFLPVFTPPWHGLDESYLELLRAAGIKGISSKGRRPGRVQRGFIRNNIHCVPIQWTEPPSFGEPDPFVGQLVSHLEQRRSAADRGEATGILTHHLVQTQDSLEFVRDVLDLVTDHPSARLVEAAVLFEG